MIRMSGSIDFFIFLGKFILFLTVIGLSFYLIRMLIEFLYQFYEKKKFEKERLKEEMRKRADRWDDF